VPSQWFTKRDSGQASETRQMAEAEQRGPRPSGALGIVLLLLGVAALVALYFLTRK
jgi:hypothetical protein